MLYRNAKGRVAHECIVDPRPLKATSGVTVDDIAKRLIDYGFHAPTMSFPVPGTLMIEPTESESKAELDRFCDAMIAIRREIAEIESGRWKVEASPLRHAPHTVHDIADDNWARAYSRAEGCFPAGTLAHGQILVPGRARRQCLWRPQPGVLVPADRRTTRRRRSDRPQRRHCRTRVLVQSSGSVRRVRSAGNADAKTVLSSRRDQDARCSRIPAP